jgi:hypothetical protein
VPERYRLDVRLPYGVAIATDLFFDASSAEPCIRIFLYRYSSPFAMRKSGKGSRSLWLVCIYITRLDLLQHASNLAAFQLT